jgi:hypothetical protein
LQNKKKHVEPCCVVLWKTMQGRKTCARRQEKSKGKALLSIDSSILGSLHSFNFFFFLRWANQIGSLQKNEVGLVRRPQLINMKQNKYPKFIMEVGCSLQTVLAWAQKGDELFWEEKFHAANGKAQACTQGALLFYRFGLRFVIRLSCFYSKVYHWIHAL